MQYTNIKTVETKTTTEMRITLRSLFLSRSVGSDVVTFAVGSTCVDITRVLRIAFQMSLKLTELSSLKSLGKTYITIF